MEFAIIGQTELPKDDIKIAIEKLGGKLASKIHWKLAGIISNAAEVKKMNVQMAAAKVFGVQVLPEIFLDMVTGDDALELINTFNIADWGTDVSCAG